MENKKSKAKNEEMDDELSYDEVRKALISVERPSSIALARYAFFLVGLLKDVELREGQKEHKENKKAEQKAERDNEEEKRKREIIHLLKKLRKEMIRRGFSRGLAFLRAGREDEDVEGQEASDRAKHLRLFREIAQLKKAALSTVKLALYNDALKKHIHNPLLKRHLPPAGQYIPSLVSMRYNAILAYKYVYKLLSSYGEIVKAKRYLVDDMGIGYYVSEEYIKQFKDVHRIREVKRVRRTLPLISSTYIRRLLAVSAVSAAYEDVKRREKEEEDKELIEYNKILQKHNILPYVVLDVYNGFDEVKEELVKKGFAMIDDGEFITKAKILDKIRAKKRAFYMNMLTKAKALLKDELLAACEKGRLPSMVKKPTLSQLAILKALNPSMSDEELKKFEQDGCGRKG